MYNYVDCRYLAERKLSSVDSAQRVGYDMSINQKNTQRFVDIDIAGACQRSIIMSMGTLAWTQSKSTIATNHNIR